MTTYYIENGKLFCNDGIFDEPYEIECSVGAFLEILELEKELGKI